MGKVQLSRGRTVGGQNAQDHAPAKVRDINYKYIYDRFASRPLFTNGGGDVTAVGTTGAENVMTTDAATYEYHVLGAGQTILFPTFNSAKGVDIVQDLISTEGSEVSLGIDARSRGAFTVGTDECYFKVQLELTDVSGISDCFVGFREQEAYNADHEVYENIAGFNIQVGVINIQTIVNDGATVTTDTTETDWIDDAVHTLEVRVDRSGVVTFFYDDVVPTVTSPTFTLTDGDVIMPCIYQLLGANAANGIFISEWQSGLGKRSV